MEFEFYVEASQTSHFNVLNSLIWTAKKSTKKIVTPCSMV